MLSLVHRARGFRWVCAIALFSFAALGNGLARAETLNDFPCKGCFLHVPDRDAGAGPRPLLVALHGDNGGTHIKKLFRAWTRACDEAGVLLVAPRCPVDEGC